MFYFKESLLFIYICIVIEITPIKIHQDMISSGKTEAGSEINGRNDGIQLEQTTPVSTTTTAEPSCSDLVGYSQYNNKWMKLSPDNMTSSACETYCNTDDTRMMTVKSNDDKTAMLALLNSTDPPSTTCHLGLQQLSFTNYQWSDGTSMTISTVDGSTDLEGGFTLWAGSTDYDQATGSMDLSRCFSIYRESWYEEVCDGINRKCACECKY